MTAPTLFSSPFAMRRAAILACPAPLQLVLNLHDPIAYSLEPGIDAGITATQRAIAAELIASHTRDGDADAGFVLLATAAETALANVKHEYGAMAWAALTSWGQTGSLDARRYDPAIESLHRSPFVSRRLYFSVQNLLQRRGSCLGGCMIFVTNSEGGVTYVSPEWCTFTGQPATEATGHGWLGSLHLDDREPAITFLRKALERQCEYSLRHRLRRADGSYAWVVVGAVPSFGPPGRSFIGFLGSLTEISPSGSEPISAYGTLERFVPPPMHPATPPGSALELVADHLLMAHSLIEEDGAKEMLPVLRQALMTAGVLLARSTMSSGTSDRFH